jgi:hypothetical protein
MSLLFLSTPLALSWTAQAMRLLLVFLLTASTPLALERDNRAMRVLMFFLMAATCLALAWDI